MMGPSILENASPWLSAHSIRQPTRGSVNSTRQVWPALPLRSPTDCLGPQTHQGCPTLAISVGWCNGSPAGEDSKMQWWSNARYGWASHSCQCSSKRREG